MPAWRGALAALALVSWAAAARADDVRLHLVAHGAIEVELDAVHVIDHAHFCSAAAAPWQDPATPDRRGIPFPFYRVVFGQDGPGADLAPPGPSLGLAAASYFAAAAAHSDPVNDSIEVLLNGRHFVGHADLGDPNYRLAIRYREDRRGGGFVAHHLHEAGGGAATLDLEGQWECPPVNADVPAQEVAVHALFRGAVPARPDPTPLRLSRTDIPCVDRGCAGWRATDEATGSAYLARVDLTHLRLARALRQLAERGEVDLLVEAEVRHGAPPRVIALVLDGIAPTPPPVADRGPDPPAAIPEAALH
jgi:hypothetical protein